jgi:hypothetical protein
LLGCSDAAVDIVASIRALAQRGSCWHLVERVERRVPLRRQLNKVACCQGWFAAARRRHWMRHGLGGHSLGYYSKCWESEDTCAALSARRASHVWFTLLVLRVGRDGCRLCWEATQDRRCCMSGWPPVVGAQCIRSATYVASRHGPVRIALGVAALQAQLSLSHRPMANAHHRCVLHSSASLASAQSAL